MTPNGFNTIESQTEAHNWLLNRLESAFVLSNLSIADLGCGDGTLLEKISKISNRVVHGYDCNSNINFIDKILIQTMNKDIKDIFPAKYNLCLIAEQRFIDAFKDTIEAFDYLRKITTYLFVYNYSSRNTSWIKFD